MGEYAMIRTVAEIGSWADVYALRTDLFLSFSRPSEFLAFSTFSTPNLH